MTDYSVIFFENGFPHTIPGFLDDTAVSIFPFWGNFTIIDFPLVSFLHNCFSERYIIVHKKFKKIIPVLFSRWKNEIRDILVLENGIKDFLLFLKRIQSRLLILCFLPHIALFDPEELINSLSETRGELLKLSVDKIPLHIYFLSKKLLIGFIDDYIKQHNDEKSLFDYIFRDFLTRRIDLIKIPGNVFFSDKIIQLYSGNLWLIHNIKNKLFLDLVKQTSERIPDGKNSFIGEHGHIKNSFLSPGAEIEGYVENSVIFPEVIISKKAKVINSVIMNNNIIGRNTSIQNTIILPFYEENNVHNIGDNAVIGGKTAIGRNNDFPDQIYNGLAVLGINTTVPRGFKIEQSSYLGPYIPLKQLKPLKILKKGVSLYSKKMENKEK
ncbi:MAG: hypothetical protein JXB88_12900 [Spirochaetales bacterium]|nr:hypothetical protein [Spirochaetales bacterium]